MKIFPLDWSLPRQTQSSQWSMMKSSVLISSRLLLSETADRDRWSPCYFALCSCSIVMQSHSAKLNWPTFSLSADSVPRVGHNNTCLVPKLKNLCLGPLTSATKLFLPQPEPYSSVSSVSRHCHQLHHHGPDTCSASRSQTRSDEERREIVKLHDVSSDTELHLALTICVVSTLYWRSSRERKPIPDWQ